MNSRPGCFSGLLKFFMLGWFFDWLQDRFGFGFGCSCTGIGSVIILFIMFIFFACSIFSATNLTSFDSS